MNNINNNSCWTDIPTDISNQIFLQLPIETLLTLAKVCKTFKSLSEQDSIWQPIVINKYTEHLDLRPNISWKNVYYIISKAIEQLEKNQNNNLTSTFNKNEGCRSFIKMNHFHDFDSNEPMIIN